MSGKKTISNTTPAIGAIKIQQSTYGVVIPIVWGRTRVSGNLIWYGDFKAIPHTTTQEVGGKGGGGGQEISNTTFTYQAAVAMALCEGPVLGVRTAWRGKNIFEGSSYSGTNARANELKNYPASGNQVTVANVSGWQNISVQMRVDDDFDDGFRYNRAGVWITLVPDVDYTCSAGVYTILTGEAGPGTQLRISYTYLLPAGVGMSCLSQIGLDLFNGTPGQAPWTYLTSSHPNQAIGYSGIAYVAGAAYTLDAGAAVENHAFEIETSFMLSATVPDADPSLIASDALTNPQYGAQFGLEKLASLTDYSNACLAQGIVLSPALTEQVSASSFLDQLATLTNAGLVWSDGTLKIVPYTDTPVTGNGVTFTPNTAPIYDLTDDDFLPDDDDGPVKVTRAAVSDSFNSVKLEYFDRANDYNLAIMEQADQADIQENGPRPMPVVTAHWITESSVAKIVATLLLQRSLFIRNTYEFKLGWTKIPVEAMDIVTLTDASLGLNKQPVRILTIEESDAGDLAFVTEDFPKGSASATLYPTVTGGAGFTPNFNEPPGSPMAPVIFEGPAALATSNGGLEVWLATGSASDTFGGCEVWVSLTGSDYRRAATLSGKSRFGVTTTAMPTAAAGALTTDSLGVALSSGGQLLAATLSDATALTTLCYVDGEFFSYETSTLTGASAYTLGGHMVRGAFLSRSSASHAVGAPFVRCDDAIAKVSLTPDYIGKTIHVKLLPFNRYGGAVGSLSDATDYTYTVTGLQANQSPISPLNLGVEGPFTASSAKFRWDRIGNAANYNVQIWAGSPSAKVREVNVGDALRFDYSAADAKSDGGPWRTLTIKVQGIHANGAVGAQASFTATNAQVGALTGAAASSNAGVIQFACDKPADPDFSGILVYISATSGFTPGASTLVFDGPNTSVTINRLNGGGQLALGSTYYVRAAAYDSFDKVGLTFTPEIAVSVSNAQGMQTSIIQLYKWATSVPAKPTGSSTFTWATGVNSSYAAAPADNWLTAPGANPGTPGASLYIATIQISAPVGTATSTVDYTNSTVAAWSQNGTNGAPGVQAASATVYRWAATIPSAPTGSATYKWSDGTFGAAPTTPDTWTLTPGTAPSAGMTLWAARVALVDSAANTTTAFTWQNQAAVIAIGYAGSNGGAGASYVTAYCASATASATSAPAPTTGKTSLPAANSGGITGTWSAAVPTLSAGQFMYQSDGIYDPATNQVTWSTPYWSSLKVATLSAITANLGSINAGSINLGGGVFTVDNAGNLVCYSITILKSDGSVLLRSDGTGSIPAAIDAAAVNTSLVKPVEDGSVWSGGTVTTVADGKVGPITRRSNGYENAACSTRTAIDRTRTYRTRFWARASSNATGLLYHDLHQYTAASGGTDGPVNGGRSPYKPSSQPAHTDWREYNYTWTAADWQTGVTHVAPDFLLNYPPDNTSTMTGWWEVQGYSFQDVTDAAAAANNTLVGRGVAVQGNTLKKISGSMSAWDADAYSLESAPYAYAIARVTDLNYGVFFGLNNDPQVDGDYTSITFNFYIEAGGHIYTGINNDLTNQNPVAVDDVLMITYDGVNAKWYKNGTLLRTYAIDIGGVPLYFDSSFAAVGATLGGVQFGPITDLSAITTSVADKLSKSAGGILQGPVALQTSGGVVTGTLTWDSAGVRTGGYGVAMTKRGVVAYKSDGTLTFILDGSTGDAAFAGQLSAAYGSFGAMDIASGGYVKSGQNAFRNGTGFFLGYSGSTPVMSIGVAGGQEMYWDGTALVYTGNISLTPPTVTFNTTGISATKPNQAASSSPSVSLGSITISISGGRAPYTQVTTLTSVSTDPEGGNCSAAVTNETTTTPSFTGRVWPQNTALLIYWQTLVTDSNGQVTVKNGSKRIQFGTAQ